MLSRLLDAKLTLNLQVEITLTRERGRPVLTATQASRIRLAPAGRRRRGRRWELPRG